MEIELLKDPDTNLIFAHLQSKNVDECLRQMQIQNIEYIIFNSAFGWEEGADLSFLKVNTWIKGIRIVNEVCDLSPINYLHDLRYFGGAGNYIGGLDFSNFPFLEFLAFQWNDKKYKNFEQSKNLTEVRITKFPFENLKVVSSASVKIQKLHLFYATQLETLDGIENLKLLHKLDFYSAPKLENILSISGTKNSLKNLSFRLCHNIQDYCAVGQLTNLETFVIQKSAAMHTILFLKQLKKLWYVSIEAEILDGDISYLNEKNFKFKKMKKYEK